MSSLESALEADTRSLLQILRRAGRWDENRDAKLDALHTLLTEEHP